MRLFALCVFIVGTLVSSVFGADIGADYLNYSIPIEAKKSGPYSLRDPELTVYIYSLTGATTDLFTATVAREYFRKDVLVERALFLNGKLHGVQRKWRPNGILAEESPYLRGTMQGVYRRWSERGELIAQYTIVRGSGLARIYHTTGFIASEKRFEDGLAQGIRTEGYPGGGLENFGYFAAGDPVGVSCSFFEDGSISSVACIGLVIHFRPTGAVWTKNWYLRERPATEAEYAAAAASDSSLARYYSDPMKYKDLVPEEAKALMVQYRTAKPVKIPLEFDAQGQPLPAGK